MQGRVTPLCSPGRLGGVRGRGGWGGTGERGQVRAPSLGRWKPFQDTLFLVFQLFPRPLERAGSLCPQRPLPAILSGVLGDRANLPDVPVLVFGDASFIADVFMTC